MSPDEAMDEREHTIVDHTTMSRTPRQWIFTVVSLRDSVEKRHGKLDHAGLASWIKENVNLAVGQMDDGITTTFVKSCVELYDAFYVDHPVLGEIVNAHEEEFGLNVALDSVPKMYLVVSKCRTAQNMEWCLRAVTDAVKAQLYKPGQFSHASLKGETGSKGFLDLWLAKLQLKKYFLGEFLDKDFGNGSSHIKEAFRDVYAGFQEYRSFVGFGESQDRSWQQTWPASATMAARLIEDVLYGKQHDATLKYLLRSKKTPDEILEAEKFNAILEDIDEQLSQEAESRDKNEGHVPVAARASHEQDAADPQDEAEMNREMLLKLIDEVPDEVDGELLDEFACFRKQAKDTAHKILLMVEPNTSGQAATAIATALTKRSDQDKDKLTVFVYNVCLSGEAVTNPKVRKPPLRDHYRKMISAALQGVKSDSSIPPGVVFIVLNGGKEGGILSL